jgi:hypothetical protein
MRSLVCVLLISIGASAQAQRPDSTPAPNLIPPVPKIPVYSGPPPAQAPKAQTPKPQAAKCKTIQNCRLLVDFYKANSDSLGDYLTQAQAERDKLKSENAELTKKYDNAMTILAALNNHISGKGETDEQIAKIKEMGGSEALNLGASIETGQNNVFEFARQVSQHDSQAVEKYNALLADYKDYVTRVGIQLSQIGQNNQFNDRASRALMLYQMMQKPPTQNINVNVSDCTKLPALCVH